MCATNKDKKALKILIKVFRELTAWIVVLLYLRPNNLGKSSGRPIQVVDLEFGSLAQIQA